MKYFWCETYSLNSRDLFLNLRRLVEMTKPLRFENKSLRLKYKCLICIWIIFWAILDLFIDPKYLFQNKSFSQTYYFKSEKSFVILTSLLGLKINPGNLESNYTVFFEKSCNSSTLLMELFMICGQNHAWSGLLKNNTNLQKMRCRWENIYQNIIYL